MKKHFISIQSLRFLMFLLIFLNHINDYSPLPSFLQSMLCRAGAFSVQFFIVTSGFLLSYRHIDEYSEALQIKDMIKTATIKYKKFFPIHITTFLIAFILYLFDNINLDGHFFLNAIANVLLIQSYFPDPHIYFGFNAVSWFLSTILLLYLLYPCILYLISKYKPSIKVKSVLILFIYCIVFLEAEILMKSSADFVKGIIYINPLSRLFDFTIGCLLGSIYKDLVKIKLNCKNTSLIEILGFLLSFSSMFLLSHLQFIPVSFMYVTYFLPYNIILIMIFTLCNGIISKILENRILTYLGSISLYLFMIHQIIIRLMYILLPAFKQRNIGFQISVVLLLSIVISITFDAVSQKHKLVKFCR